MDSINKIGGGLQQSKKDKRDIAVGMIFALPKVEDLPKEFIVNGFIKVKNQGSDDTCAARASDAVSEDQEQIELCDYFSFAIAKWIDGDPASWGTQLRSVAKGHTKYGALSVKDCPLHLSDKHNLLRDRDWNNWPDKEKLLNLAKRHKKASYLSISGNYDVFDNFRIMLFFFKNELRSSFTGAAWKSIWTTSSGGIIPKFDLDKGQFGHAFKIYGWKEIAGETYLIAQLSNGQDIGDKGLFYFPRDIVNKDFSFGAYTFSDMPAEEVKQKGWNWRIKLGEMLKDYNVLKIWKII